MASAKGSNIATKLSLRHVFGFNTLVSENLSFSDDDNISYVSGHEITLYNRGDRRQRFIQSPEIVDAITAYTSGPGKRLAAIAERGERPSVHVFDLRTFRRKKTIISLDASSACREYICIYFSQDEQLLLTLTGGPDHTLTVWNWAKAKVVVTIPVSTAAYPAYRCSFSPIDSSLACAIGKDFIKFYRITDKEIRVVNDNHYDEHNFVSHCWMRSPDDHVLAGTDTGDILLFRSGEYVCHLPCSPGVDRPIWSLLSIQGGIVCGAGVGTIFIINYDDTKDQVLFDDQFSVTKILTTELTQGFFTCICMSPNEAILCASTSDGQLLTLNMLSYKTATNDMITYAVSSFHAPKSIVGLDVASRKPLLVTCSKDNTLRIWDYQSHVLELTKHFPEDMFSCAIHPNGLHIALGFTDKLRAYHLLSDDIRMCMEVSLKGCRECRFAKGGNVLAAAHGNAICIFDFHTGERLADLKGHNSKVRTLQWLDSGVHLLSCGQDGAVYHWDFDGSKRVGEFVNKGVGYNSVACPSSHAEVAYIVGSDKCIRELSMPELTSQKVIDAGAVLSHLQLAVTKTVLFASCNEYSKPGTIRTYAFPVAGDFELVTGLGAHITRMRLSADEHFLIVADDMGCVAILELKDKADKYIRLNPSSAPELYISEYWNDDIIVTTNDLDDLTNIIAELDTKVEELRLHNEYQLKLKEMNYSEKIKEITDKFIQEMEQAKTKLELLKEEKDDMKSEYIDKIRVMGLQHDTRVQEMEARFQSQIMELVDGYQKLVRQRDAQIERLDEQRKQLIFAHECYVDELTQDYELKGDEDRQTRLQYEEEKVELQKEVEENQNQLEDDIDTEIDKLKRAYEDKLTGCRESSLKYKGENGMMKKKIVVLQRDLDDQKEEKQLLLEKEKELHVSIKVLEKEVSAHKKEIKSRDVSIGEKEKKIFELKKKNQELDKFKFVLDFKIRELKQQIEPRQIEILGMRDQIKHMDAELESYHKSNLSLDDMIGALRGRIEETSEATKGKRDSAKSQESVINEFRTQLQLTMKDILSPHVLKQSVERLVIAYGSTNSIRPKIDPEIEEEYDRHKHFLQKSISQLKKNLDDGVTHHIKSNNAVMTENLSLITEINKQRDVNKTLKATVQADIGKVRGMIQTLGSTAFDNSNTSLAIDNAAGGFDDDVDPTQLLMRNRLKIDALRKIINTLNTKATMAQKAYSREILPPMDGGYIITQGEIEPDTYDPLEPPEPMRKSTDEVATVRSEYSKLSIE